MAKDHYMAALKSALKDDRPAPQTSMTKEELGATIDAISVRLKGPLNNVERLWLIEYRQTLRKQLAACSTGV